MGRKVSVGLEADVGGFIPPIEASKKAVDGLDRSVEGLDRDLNKLPADAAKAAAAMKLLGGEVGSAGNKLQTISDKSSALTVLDAKIKASRAEVRKLGDEFVRTGDVDVFGKLGAADVALRGLLDIRRKLAAEFKQQGGTSIFGSLGDDAGKSGKGAAGTFASAFQGGLLSAFSALPSEAKLALVNTAAVVGVVLAAAIGAALNSAVIAGLGGGALITAIVAQAKDPQVSTAFKALGAEILSDFQSASTSAAGPLAYSAGIFRHAWHSAITGIAGELDWLTKFIVPLSSGFAKLFTNAQPGFLQALHAAGPILQVIADELPKLGDTLSRAFSMMADGSKGAEYGMRTLFKVVEIGILFFAKWVQILSNVYEWLVNVNTALIGFAQTVLGWVPGLSQWLDMLAKNFSDIKDGSKHVTDLSETLDRNGATAKEAAKSYEELAQQLNATTETMDSLAGKMVDKIFSATMGIDRATLRWNESLTQLRETLKSNGLAIDKHSGQVAMNTAKGQENRGAVLDSVAANMELYQRMLAAGSSAEQAADAYDTNTKALEAQLRKAGYTQTAIDGLIGKYRDIPKEVNTTLAIEGLTKAINDLADLIRKINGLHDKTINITTTFKTKGHPLTGEGGTVPLAPGSAFAYGGIRKAAAGMFIRPSDPGTVLTGEPQTGGEALIPLRGISQSSALSFMRVVGDNYDIEVSPRWRSTTGAMSTPVSSAGGYTDLGPLLAEVRGLRSALAGMRVVMDGRLVGEVQGRGADLMRRGG